jgi:L-ascorbate metabolism protein UlaG (beta-lactamase superfamily)
MIHATWGDTFLTEEIEAADPDGTLGEGTVLCGQTTRTQPSMAENTVVRSVNALRLDRVFPCHYDMWKGALGDAKVLHEHAAAFEYPHSVDIAKIGDRFDVSRPGPSRYGTLRSTNGIPIAMSEQRLAP